MANNNQHDEKIMTAIREGKRSCEKRMQIDSLRVTTWSVIGERLNALMKNGAVITREAGWCPSK